MTVTFMTVIVFNLRVWKQYQALAQFLALRALWLGSLNALACIDGSPVYTTTVLGTVLLNSGTRTTKV